ncbi:NPC intracellular cholesterol transporter 2-like [Topomyia yanbarensis]|uniref:NPC intracellular cholesterol transporter 2-like n=1 Tax=Topomyia yanbarensis TaxID=2498891 RepID=UPI00273BF788|nr:NPC intracellular cholesterol transporter 2-like [Topomyia yanbarensis]
MFKYLVVAAIIPVLALASPTPFRTCPNNAPVPETFTVGDCTSLPCPIVRGQPLEAKGGNIISPVSTSTVEAYITVSLAGLDLDFPIPEELVDACANGINSCPLVAGQPFDYVFYDDDMNLPLGGITVQIRVGLRDGATEIACVEFDGALI